MKILMTGASGLVGSRLTAYLEKKGDSVTPMVREKGKGVYWSPAKQEIDREAMEGFDALINLAGENLAGRWSEEKKRKISRSRVEGTKLLAEALGQLKRPPKVFVNASAVGYYGSSETACFTEKDPPGEGFLAQVCVDWERAAAPIAEQGIRTAFVRTGVVLSLEGGALKRMLPPFRFGLGGPLGSGGQWMSWIDQDDLVRIYRLCLSDQRVSGPVNATAPEPVTNEEFSKALGRALNRPAILRAPAFLLKAVFGEMAEELLLKGAKVSPQKLQELGFSFRYPTLEQALRHLVGGEEGR